MKIRRPMCLISLGFLIFLTLAMSYLRPEALLEKGGLPYEDGRQLTLSGTCERKEKKQYGYQIYLSHVSVEDTSCESGTRTCRGIIVKISKEELYKTIKTGSHITLSGEYESFPCAMNEGEFSKAKYYHIRGYEGTLSKVRLVSQSDSYAKIREYLNELREQACEVFSSYMDAQKAGIMKAFVLGERNELDPEIKELYQNAGYAHLLSLSGLHIASVGLCLFKMLKKAGLKKVFAGLLSGILMTSYACLTGMSTSTFRALIMFLLCVVADLIGRTYDLLSALSFSCILVLLENPNLIYDTGMQLSFLSVTGIGVLAPRLRELFVDNSVFGKQGIQKLMHMLGSTLCVSIAIQLATLPVTMQNFYQVPVYSIVCNLLVIPFMGAVLGSGILSLFLYYFVPFFEICRYPLMLASLILEYYEGLAKFNLTMPGNLWICGRAELFQCISYYCILGLTFFCLPLFLKKSHYKRGWVCRMLTVIMTLLALVILSVRERAPIEIRNLYVGQGDCCLIYGKRMPTLLIDAGSSDKKEIGKYQLIPAIKANGISRISYVIVSHTDIDHVSGILELLSTTTHGIKVEHLILPELSQQLRESVECENYDKLVELAKQRDIKLMRMKRGDSLTFPQRSCTLTCLSPAAGNHYQNANDASLVMLLKQNETGFRALFTGDISKETEKSLQTPGEKIDYLKVAHHGSKNSTGRDFMKSWQSEIAVISAGIDNAYGHPHRETLETLNEVSGHVFITTDSEVITKVKRNGQMLVKHY